MNKEGLRQKLLDLIDDLRSHGYEPATILQVVEMNLKFQKDD